MADLDQNLDREDIPRGIFHGRIGSSGRMKLPAKVWRYLLRISDEPPQVFVTSLDMKTVRIYALSAWKRNQETLSSYTENPKAAETVLFMANAMGRDSDVDDQGRIVVPAGLRRKLELEGKDVSMTCHKGRITLYAEKLYEERFEEAESQLPEANEAIEQARLL